MTRLATISNPNLFHWNFSFKFSFLWGRDLTKNILQVFVSIWNHKLLFVIIATHEPGFGISCMLFSLVLVAWQKVGEMPQFVALKPVLREKAWFRWLEISFPNQQIYQVNFIHFNLIINLVESLHLQLYWRGLAQFTVLLLCSSEFTLMSQIIFTTYKAKIKYNETSLNSLSEMGTCHPLFIISSDEWAFHKCFM